MLPNDNSRIPFRKIDKEDYPQLGLRVLIVGNCFREGAVRMFAQAGCSRAETVADAELIVFLGGEDIDPDLYGEKPLAGTYFNRARDDREMDIFVEAQRLGVPCFGICRGMQFLHAMNGSKLYQHVYNHAGADHAIIDLRSREQITVSSMHHQMCIEDDSVFPLAYAARPGHSGRYHTFSTDLSTNTHKDLEAAVYPAINAIAVQGHPEVEGTPRYRAWCLERISEWLDEGIGENTLEKVAFIQTGVRDV